jgi:hypothetical protein
VALLKSSACSCWKGLEGGIAHTSPCPVSAEPVANRLGLSNEPSTVPPVSSCRRFDLPGKPGEGGALANSAFLRNSAPGSPGRPTIPCSGSIPWALCLSGQPTNCGFWCMPFSCGARSACGSGTLQPRQLEECPAASGGGFHLASGGGLPTSGRFPASGFHPASGGGFPASGGEFQFIPIFDSTPHSAAACWPCAAC